MAWIKVDHTTVDKPEVMQMADALGMPPEQVMGHIVRVWVWADQQSLDGHAISVTEKGVDRVARHAGFAEAMRKAGWLLGTDGAISFPNFDRHNGETAKTRALASRRKVTERSRSKRDNSVTREEKNRSKNKTTTPPNGGATIWDFGRALLIEQGLSAQSAGALIGSWLREWPEADVAEALRLAAGKADIRSYAAAILKAKPKKATGPQPKVVAL